MKKEKKRRLRVWPIIIILVLICFVGFVFCVKNLYNSIKNKAAKEIKVLETIETYNYRLNENDSKYVKSLFKDLKGVLEADSIDEEAYASILSQIFVADFYSLNDCINKNDVGGKQFVYQAYQEDFLKGAKASVYRYVENNIYENRKQELPTVTNVEVINLESIKYKTGIMTDEKAYQVDVSVTYDKNLGYPANVTLLIIHSNQKLEIAEMKK